MKNQVIKTIGFVAGIAHVSITLAGNAAKAITDFTAEKIAQGEGYLVSKIDSTRDPVEVAKLREEKTREFRIKAAEKIYTQKRIIQENLKKQKQKFTKQPAPVLVQADANVLSDDDRAQMATE